MDRRSLATIRLEPIAPSPSAPASVRALSPPPPGIYVVDESQYHATSAASPAEVDTTPRSSSETTHTASKFNPFDLEGFKNNFFFVANEDAGNLVVAADAPGPLENSEQRLGSSGEAIAMRRCVSVVSGMFSVMMAPAKQNPITANSDRKFV